MAHNPETAGELRRDCRLPGWPTYMRRRTNDGTCPAVQEPIAMGGPGEDWARIAHHDGMFDGREQLLVA